MHHLLELRPGNPRFALTLFIDEMDLFGDVASAEQQYAFAGQPVASRASGLLIIALEIFRQIVVHNEANVRFVDPHPEGNRSGDHTDIVP